MSNAIEPVIKWAGGKRRLAPAIAYCIQNSVYKRKGTYFEPFLGGGALMFYLRPAHAIGIDRNPELINFYEAVRDTPEELSRILLDDFSPNHSESFYYEIRSWDRDEREFLARSKVQRAARFVYLNKSCFNGIWRVNASGQNNVPWNHNDYVSIPSLEKILKLHDYLNKHTNFLVGDYKDALRLAKKGDFVYFDPPYDVEHNQSGFTGYTRSKFDRDDQTDLKLLCDSLMRIGVGVAISNSNTDFIKNLYMNEDNYELYTIVDESKLKIKRNIGAKVSSRKYVNELLILGKACDGRKNYPPFAGQ